MSDIINVPAGVIQPKPLLMWLHQRRNEARAELEALDFSDNEQYAEVLGERIDTYIEVIQHISFGGGGNG